MRAVIEWIEAFGALQAVHDSVGEGRGEHFVQHFAEIAGDDQVGDQAGIEATAESNDHQDESVHRLADDGGADGAGPEMPAAGEDLHLGHHERVREFAAPEGHEARDHQPGDKVEHGCESLLVGPVGRGGKRDRDHAHDGQQTGGKKAQPDGAAGRRIAVNLREHVAENVGDGKQQLGAADAEPAEGADLLAYQVGDQEHDHEDDDQQLVVAEVPERFGQAILYEDQGRRQKNGLDHGQTQTD